MAFEAGLATALVLSGATHERFLLEERRYRLQVSLSDLNGTDPYVHGGTVRGLLAAVNDIFTRPDRAVRMTDVERIYRRLSRYATGRFGDDLYRPAAFSELVYVARQLTSGMGVVP